MKKNLILLVSPILLLMALLMSGYKLHHEEKAAQPKEQIAVRADVSKTTTTRSDQWVSMPDANEPASTYSDSTQKIIEYALSLIGSPYQYAGITPEGFDCSGFVTHVFDEYDIAVPHSSALQAEEGRSVSKSEAAPGDIVIFTGTDENDRTPGHVGIVVSEPGDTIAFVHSSSNGGVKISKVQGTRYDIRYLEVRRVL